MARSQVRLGVVGAGQFGRRHLQTIRAEPLAELAGVADPAGCPGEHAPVFGSVEELLDKSRPEGVVIATPNALHVPAALACVERGIPVLVEKPVAETLEAARSLVEAAARKGVPVLVGHHRRHNPRVVRARELVQGGALGRLAAVAAFFLLQKPEGYFDAAWRRSAGGGPLLINLIHDVDVLRYVCGEIEEVRAISSSAVRGFEVEDSAAVSFRFAGGAVGTATVSDAVAAPWSWELGSGENPVYPRRDADCYFFTGTAGSLALPSLTRWRYEGRPGWHEPLSMEAIEVEDQDPQVLQMRHFCRVVRGEEPPRVSGEDAARTLAAVLAIHESSRSGAAVRPAWPR